MVIIEVKIPNGYKYNQVQQNLRDALKGSIGYIKGSIRIRPVSNDSSKLRVELGDPKDKDVVVTSIAGDILEMAHTYSSLTPQQEEPSVQQADVCEECGQDIPAPGPGNVAADA